MRVDVWSDIVCPWCYLGHARFGAALARFEHRDQVEVVHRSFELDPGFGRRAEVFLQALRQAWEQGQQRPAEAGLAV